MLCPVYFEIGSFLSGWVVRCPASHYAVVRNGAAGLGFGVSVPGRGASRGVMCPLLLGFGRGCSLVDNIFLTTQIQESKQNSFQATGKNSTVHHTRVSKYYI